MSRAMKTGWILACAAALAGCGGPPPAQPSVVERLRGAGPTSTSTETVAQWLAAELLSPGGKATAAAKARKRLDELGAKDSYAHFLRGLDDSLHGRAAEASNHFLEAAKEARTSGDPIAPLIGWLSVHRAATLRHETSDLWKRWKPFVETALKDPKDLGWRARGELVEWALDEAWTSATPKLDELAVGYYGCLTHARLAGPFGRGANADANRSFDAERPGPWPARWEPDPMTGLRPEVLKVSQEGCAVDVDGATHEGIFYVESFFDLDTPTEVLVAVQGALAVWVDDRKVLDRDLRVWAVWPRFGVQVALGAGRHRIVARLGEPATSIRLMRPDGTPLGIDGSDDPRPPYAIVPPRISADPNVLSRYVRNGDVVAPKDALTTYVAAHLAHVESADDLANVLLEPLLGDMTQATGPVLTAAALFTEGDPLFDRNQTQDLVRELNERAVERDPALWQAELSHVTGEAERRGLADVAPELEALARRFEEVSAIARTLIRVYGELGWVPEHHAAVLRAFERFPDDLEVLHAAVDVYDAEGKTDAADELVARIQRLDDDSEISLGRALTRQDYDSALAELERLAARRPSRKDLTERIHDVMVRAGNTSETWKKLEATIDKDPTDGRAWLDLADARFARGDRNALPTVLAEAVEADADTSLLSNAIALVEGMTTLEPYRLDPMPVIEAYETSGQYMPGNAARVLDYAAIWVRSDGSSQMLEHEIVKLQSPEGIEKFAEHRRLEGLVLRMRVIKQDGTTLEPEEVPGKPTVTFPHLEVGDYIETEQVIYMRGDGSGAHYLSPRWFFREENVAYARSEFLIVAPRDRDVVIETTGAVPEPEVEPWGAFVSRHWRVDHSPAAPAEPHSAPITEFLPSVRLGWGVDLETHLTRLGDAIADVTPTDPRIVRVARRIVETASRGDDIARAKRLYRWVLDNVEPDEESDGRRVIMSKRGNRWRAFLTLARALGIDARYAVAKNRLAPPALGPISLAQQFTEPALVVSSGKRVAWLNLNEKFAPFGYIPAEVRGMPAYVLDGEQHVELAIPVEGDEDGLWFEGHGTLAADGSLELELTERFSGKLAMAMRSGLAQLPEQRLRDALESNLLQRALSGAKLVDYSVKSRDDLDAPLAVTMKAKLDRFAEVNGKRLVISPPFVLALSRLTALPTRQTPLLVSDSVHRRVEMTITLPKGAKVTLPDPAEVTSGSRTVSRRDTSSGGKLVLRRRIDFPAGRVQPADYAEFARFTERADELQTAAVIVQL